jgi:hypothetical protein
MSQSSDIDYLKRRITEAVAAVTCDMLRRVWEELDYRFDIFCVIRGGSHRVLVSRENNFEISPFSLYITRRYMFSGTCKINFESVYFFLNNPVFSDSSSIHVLPNFITVLKERGMKGVRQDGYIHGSFSSIFVFIYCKLILFIVDRGSEHQSRKLCYCQNWSMTREIINTHKILENWKRQLARP